MKFDIRFKGIEYSESLAQYTEERFDKIQKFEMKPVKVNVTYSTQRHHKCAEVYVQGVNSSFRASAKGENYYDCLDDVVRKLSRQMSKEKSKVQHHRHSERAHLARLEEAIRAERSYKKAA